MGRCRGNSQVGCPYQPLYISTVAATQRDGGWWATPGALPNGYALELAHPTNRVYATVLKMR